MYAKCLVRIAIVCVTLTGISVSTCRGQEQEVLEEINSGLQRKRPNTPTREVYWALQNPIITKEFHVKVPMREFLRKFPDMISKKGKEIEVVVDFDAFNADNQIRRDIRDEEICLPEIPVKLVANTALRLAIAQVGLGTATYRIQRGQIVITSLEKAQSNHFLETSVVTGNYKNRPLVDVLDDFAEQTGVSIIVDIRVLKKAQAMVTAKISTKLPTAVHLLADGAGLKSVVVDNVLYVTSPENGRQFTSKTDIKLGQMGGPGGVYSCKDCPLLKGIEVATQNYVIDGRIKNKLNTGVAAKWMNEVNADTAIRLLTDMAGVGYFVVDDVVYITSPKNAKKLNEELSRKRP